MTTQSFRRGLGTADELLQRHGAEHGKASVCIASDARCYWLAERQGEDCLVRAPLTFRLFIKPFLDAQTWDEDRIDHCCTHVIRLDGKRDSFCHYYSGFADCKTT